MAAEYAGFTGHSWSDLLASSPATAAFATVIFRIYGAYNVAFGLLAMFIAPTAFRAGDRWAVLGGLAATAPFLAAGSPVHRVA